MSLINDALKRARLQAARQEERSLSRLYREAPADLPKASRLGPGIVLTVVVALAAAVVATILIVDRPPLENEAERDTAAAGEDRLRPMPDGGADSIEPPPTAETKVAATTPQTAMRKTSPAEAAGGSIAAAERPAQPEASERPTPSTSEKATGHDATPVADASDASAAGATSKPEDPPAGLDGMTFLKVVDLPDGSRLELSGIAWSGAHPVAVISGNVVGQGELVEGFTVVAIEQNAVELRGLGSTFFIRLR